MFYILKGANFVEERRKKLQVYLRQIMNFLITINRILANSPNKYNLVNLVPFFRYFCIAFTCINNTHININTFFFFFS